MKNFAFSLLFATFLTVPGAAVPVVIYDNLTQPNGGSGPASASTLQAQAFSTGATGGAITQAILQMRQASAGLVQVDIFSSATGSVPGSFLGSLALSSGLSSSFSPVVFTGMVAVSANSNYFAVLRPTSGTFSWSFTESNTGSGVGFRTNYAFSGNSGASWTAYPDSPYQMSISLEVPEVSSTAAPLAISLVASMLLGLSSKRNRKA